VNHLDEKEIESLFMESTNNLADFNVFVDAFSAYFKGQKPGLEWLTEAGNV